MSIETVHATDVVVVGQEYLQASARAWYGKEREWAKVLMESLKKNVQLVFGQYDLIYTPLIRLCHIKGTYYGLTYGRPDASSIVLMDVRRKYANDLDEFYSSLCHELVHVKQWERGDWTKDSDDRFYWKGSLVSETTGSLGALTREEYNALPWEVEANEVGEQVSLSLRDKLDIF